MADLRHKQVIVWRHDLKVRLGKSMAQAGHAAMAHFRDLILSGLTPDRNVTFKLTAAEEAWLKGDYAKIVLRVENEQELLTIYQRAKDLGLPVQMVTDNGYTEFKGVPTKTCLAIGPEESEKIDQVTGEAGPLGRLKPL